VPDAVRALRLEERRLAWGVTDSGTAVVATPTSLLAGSSVVLWTSVAKASWDPPVLSVREVAEVEGAGTLHRFVLVEDDGLAEVVRAQVTSSVGWTDVRRLQPGGKVRVVGRRVPGQDALLWQTVWLDGTDPSDPLLRVQAEELVAALRGTIG
jgi:hypothetical protein